MATLILGNGWIKHTKTRWAGVIEAGLSPFSTQGEASQFDTNDMVLHFHPVRILHDTLTSKFGLDLNNTPVPNQAAPHDCLHLIDYRSCGKGFSA